MYFPYYGFEMDQPLPYPHSFACWIGPSYFSNMKPDKHMEMVARDVFNWYSLTLAGAGVMRDRKLAEENMRALCLNFLKINNDVNYERSYRSYSTIQYLCVKFAIASFEVDLVCQLKFNGVSFAFPRAATVPFNREILNFENIRFQYVMCCVKKELRHINQLGITQFQSESLWNEILSFLDNYCIYETKSPWNQRNMRLMNGINHQMRAFSFEMLSS